jgi:peptidoglycan/LPS O-acetylase OafA/YrhL
MNKDLVPSRHLNGLDHLRALAITLVFFYHYRMFAHPGWIDDGFSFAWTGVDLFFVLSGYLIAGQLFEQINTTGTIHKRTFFIKRFFRIIPPFLVVLCIYFLIPSFREREALPPVWKFLTFTQNFGLDVIHSGTFSHAWSLCIEEQFYLVLPFLLLLFYRKGKWHNVKYLLPILLLAVLLLRLLSWYLLVEPRIDEDDFGLQWYKRIYYPTYTRLDGLLIGVSIAAIMHYRPLWKSRVNAFGSKWLLPAAAIIAIAYFICEDQYSFTASTLGFLLVAIGCGLLVLAAIAERSFLNKTTSFVTTQLAALSYSIYLSHKGVIHVTQVWLEKAGLDIKGHISLVICIISCVAVGLLFRYLVEKPALRIRNHILRKKLGSSSRKNFARLS